MKKLNLVAAAVVLAAASFNSMAAGSAADQFDVTINFTSSCTVKTQAADLEFNYTAFGSAVPVGSPSTSTVFQCTRGLTPQFSFDNTVGTSNGPKAVTQALTAEGVIQGVRYTLAGTTSKSATGNAATAGAGGTGGSNGSADEYTVAITAAIAAGQAGDGSGGPIKDTRTLTISY